MHTLAAAEGRFCQSYLIASSSLVLGVKYVKEEVQRQTFDKEEGRKASLSPSVPCLSSSLSLSSLFRQRRMEREETRLELPRKRRSLVLSQGAGVRRRRLRRQVYTTPGAIYPCLGLPRASLGWSTGLTLGKPRVL